MTRSGAGGAAGLRVDRLPAPATSSDALELELAHQPGDALLATPYAARPKLGVQAGCVVGLARLGEGGGDQPLQLGIPQRAA